MKIQISLTQRLQVSFVIGEQTGTAAEMHRCGSILDKVDLTEDEKKAVELKAEPSGVVLWDAVKGAAQAEIDFSSEDIATLNRVLKEWKGFRPRDREWLKSLMKAIA